MATITHTDYLFQQGTGGALNLVPGVWVRLLNNSTAVNYYSTAVTDATSAFTHSAVPGDYSLYTGSAATVVGTPTLRNAHYSVPVTAGDDAVVGSLTDVATGPYTATAVAGGGDFGAALRVTGGNPWFDVTHPTFGAKGDGTTNDTAAIQAALQAAYNAGGGVVWLPAATYLVSGQLTMPFAAGGGITATKPIKLLGSGALINGQWASGVNGGTVLDMRATTAPAKLDTRGAGGLEIEGINFITGLAGDTNPFIQTTNTTLRIHDCAFIGDTTKSGATCVQDAIVLGGTSTALDMTVNAAFQGYGTIIRDNYFNRIRRGVLGRTYSNNVWVARNTFSSNCGAADGTTAAIHILAPAANPSKGIVIRDNLIECTNYPYSIRCETMQSSLIDGNSFWDGTAANLACVYLDANSINNTVLVGGYNGTSGKPFVIEATIGTNTIMDIANFWVNQLVTQLSGKTLQMFGSEIDFGPAGGPADIHILRQVAGRISILEKLDAKGDDHNFGAVANPLTIGTLGTGDSWVSAATNLRLRAQGAGGQIVAISQVQISKDLLRSRQTPTEAVLVSGVDATTGELVAVTITAARVVGAPLNPAVGQNLTFEFTQGGVGAFAVTWNAVFKKTWADTGNATGKISTITFYYNGTNWVQTGAQAPYV